MSPTGWAACWPSGTGRGRVACQLQYRGEVASQDTKLLTASFCAGLLEQVLDEDVNIVNSEMLMKERGIQLTEQRDTEMGDFSSSMAADVTSEGRPGAPRERCSARRCPA